MTAYREPNPPHPDGPDVAPEPCWCCGGAAPIRGNGDPWEGRLDGYCTSCAITRCDTTDSTCGVAGLRGGDIEAEVPDECHCPGYPCEHVPPPIIHLEDRVGYKLGYSRPVTMAMANELGKAGLWACADLARKYAVDRPRWWHRFTGGPS